MQFNITIIDPPGFAFGHFLFDACKLICYGLESLGHDCSISRNQVVPGRTTILVGGHLLPSLRDVEAIAATGPFIVYQTEVLQLGAINTWRSVEQEEHFDTIYMPLLQKALAVWEGTKSNIPVVESFGGRGYHLLGGYHPGLCEIIHKRNPDVDFLFYGSVTEHRKRMLDPLLARGHNLIVLQADAALFRNDWIARTKVHLVPRQGDTMNHLAWGRIGYLLNNGCLPVVERALEQDWLQACFLWSETEQWIELCEHTLYRADRREVCSELTAKYQQIPFTQHLEQVLDEMYGGS